MSAPDPLHRYRTRKRREHMDRLNKARRRYKTIQKAARDAEAKVPVPKRRRGRPTTDFPAPVMPPDSKPSWAAEAVGDRRLWCRRYDTCLSYAAAEKWPGFDCGACRVREEEPPTTRLLEGMHVGQQDDIREVWAAIRGRA